MDDAGKRCYGGQGSSRGVERRICIYHILVEFRNAKSISSLLCQIKRSEFEGKDSR